MTEGRNEFSDMFINKRSFKAYFVVAHTVKTIIKFIE